jgi:hypothetical protein
MSDKQNGGAAFPSPGVVLDFSLGQTQQGAYEGMSLRDYFAAKCNLRPYQVGDIFYRTYGRNPDASELAALIAEIRYIEADAMLAARNK